jgi:hypothetical protein
VKGTYCREKFQSIWVRMGVYMMTFAGFLNLHLITGDIVENT